MLAEACSRNEQSGSAVRVGWQIGNCPCCGHDVPAGPGQAWCEIARPDLELVVHCRIRIQGCQVQPFQPYACSFRKATVTTQIFRGCWYVCAQLQLGFTRFRLHRTGFCSCCVRVTKATPWPGLGLRLTGRCRDRARMGQWLFGPLKFEPSHAGERTVSLLVTNAGRFKR